ncbi:MAG: hybrid sensor histidine kinase/response regulator [Chloroflexi bacterium]|nr:hybrid sensor histidine kinase/response regulator [Chloroflexota bacterium]
MSDRELLNIFWVEVAEYLEALNNMLLQIETIPDGNRHGLLREMNRVAHSMKGAARAVGIGVIETVAHYMEEVFNAGLENHLQLTPDICDTLYDGLDVIQNSAKGGESDKEMLAQVLAHLEQIIAITKVGDQKTASQTTSAVAPDGHKKSSQTVPQVSAPAPPSATPLHTATHEMRVVSASHNHAIPNSAPLEKGEAQTMMLRPSEDTIRVAVNKLDRLMAEASELLVARMHGEERQRQLNHLRRMHARWQKEWRSVRAAYIRLVRRLQDKDDEMAAELAEMFTFLELNQRNLSETMRFLGQLAQNVVQDNMHLSALAEQLQDDISAMRMIPFESIVGGFQRMVRDLARDMGKQVQLDVTSTAVELDKTVLDALKDPIMHLLRNAIDHGIEAPGDRDAAKKPIAGRIVLAVEQRGSEILVRVADDGRGIDPARVRASAVRSGIISEVDAAGLSDEEARLLIFQPGLTTSASVTAVSGRGLGMDIVRDRVENMRGRVSVQSILGRGTTITLSVPVSLTRIRCILLRVGSEEYAVPSNMVVRMEKMARTNVFTAEGRDVVLINEHPLPLTALGSLLDTPLLHSDADQDKLSVLVLRAADRQIAFEVDDLYSEQELVLKALGPEIARARYVAGAALLGSGDVIIVLDANDLVRGASGIALPKRRRLLEAPSAQHQRLRVLVVDDSITTRTLEKNILETAGFEVHVAIDGFEGWRMVNEIDLDVIVCDVEMPNMNGLELTQRIKDSPSLRDIPVILLTSLSKPEQREAGLRAGANAYLVKSQFDQGELLQTIQDVL